MSNERQRYFFDANNFDAPNAPEPEENLPPPPPVYSEDELAAAKAEAFEEGRGKGHADEQKNREQYIANQISDLNTQILSLILSEQMREKKFEQEVIHTCRGLFSKLLPSLTSTGGLDEIYAVISRTVLNQQKSIIDIEVPMDDVNDIKEKLSTLKDIQPENINVVGNAELGKGNCRMKWQDGGAIRDHEALIQAIMKQLDETLAPPPQKVHNNESEESVTTEDGDEQDGRES